jgi:hypothetical protein
MTFDAVAPAATQAARLARSLREGGVREDDVAAWLAYAGEPHPAVQRCDTGRSFR